MSAKNEKEKEKRIEKTNDKKVVDKKEPTKKKKIEKPVDNNLYCLIDLINELEDSRDIFVKLSLSGYYKQFIKEQELQKKGYTITPTITKTEFNKILQIKL